jgi:hypothetical protein
MNAFYEHHKDSIRFGYRCFVTLPRSLDEHYLTVGRRLMP